MVQRQFWRLIATLAAVSLWGTRSLRLLPAQIDSPAEQSPSLSSPWNSSSAAAPARHRRSKAPVLPASRGMLTAAPSPPVGFVRRDGDGLLAEEAGTDHPVHEHQDGAEQQRADTGDEDAAELPVRRERQRP